MKHSPDFSSRFRILKGGKISLVVSALMVTTTLLHAAPSGGVVTSGSASIAHSGSVTTINQSSQKASINWQNFSIGATETVNFHQPSVNAITLNRAVGNEKSIISGALNANGQVWILNSNGVLFNSSAKVNTAGLLATTMQLSDEDFQNGVYSFKGDSSASVINLGEITIRDGGYASLLAHSVQNEGTIKAIHGTVTLTGAREATINLNGNSLVSLKVDKGVLDALVENKGAIYADGGEVYLTTNAVGELLKGVVNNTGIVEANSIDDITGKVELYAHGGALHVSGTLEAEGGFIETSGKSLHVEDSTIIKTKKWLLDPVNMTIENTGGASLTGASVSATAIQNALSTADIELQATTNITVNENITWSTDKQLKLSADSINVNKTIENTNTANGGVYFSATNVRDKVVFGTDGKVIIHNPYQIQWMNQALAGKYELGSDINLNGFTWVPIITSEVSSIDGETITNYYGFSGTFDGLGHTISNLTISDATKDKVGFFGETTGATIKNVGLVNVNITGKDTVGTLVGSNNGTSTIENAYATGSVSGVRWVGGLVGENINSSTIKNSYAIVTVSATVEQVSGLVGNRGSNAPIINSYASGTVTGTTTDVGGLVGYYSGGTGGVTNSYYDNQANTVGTMGDTGFGKTKSEIITLAKANWSDTFWGTSGDTIEGYTTDIIALPVLKTFFKPTATLFNSGYGTSANPYTITNWTQLQNINYNTATLSKYFTLSNNIDNTTAGYTNSGAGFVPTGTQANQFKGTFDGLGNTISDLYINRPTTNHVGLFGFGNGATIRNIGIVNANITGNIGTGGLAGLVNDGTITNAYATGSVTGEGNMVGGLVGTISGSTITNSYATVGVIGSGNEVGGLVGGAYSTSSIANSYATGSVEGVSNIGGLIGVLYNSSTITNSYATGSVTGTSVYGGLLGGFNSGGAVTNSYWDTQTSGQTNSARGLGKTTAQMQDPLLYANAGWNSTIWAYGSGSGVAGYGIGLAYLKNVTAIADRPAQTTLFAGGYGTSANPYTITNWTQLQNINYNIPILSKYFTLLNNINNTTAGYTDLASATANSGAGWNPIGNQVNSFSGNFNGANYTIGNLFINNSTAQRIGLFGHTLNATLENIGVIDADITGKTYVGILAGWVNGGTVKNSYTSGIVKVSYQIGGGLVGQNQSTIDHSYSLAQVEGSGIYFGGLVGGNQGVIRNSYATGKVIGTTAEFVGGLVGLNNSDTASIANSYATGEVTGANNVGGLAGENRSGSIINSYATGKITGTKNVGGLVGENLGDIKTSYAMGEVAGGTNVGGLVGNDTATIGFTSYTGTIDAVSFWDTQTSKQPTSVGGVGKTTAQMKESATYAGWDILEDNTLNSNYPTLRMASSGTVWVMGTKSTPTPIPTPTNNPTQTPNVTAIVNGTAITLPVIPNFTPPTPPTQAPQQFSVGGQMVQLVSIPSTDVASQLVGTPEARVMMQGADVGDLRVPLGQNSQIQLVNGGVNLPAGVEQQYFMAQR
ncbi:MAG: filamentous hemagglutinin N-terminal domain-containing protein [Campylobacterales bacterium]|nr:filamentous hemagglutinin N-terminal domain-containing protein [Campylobacterales bacterium]